MCYHPLTICIYRAIYKTRKIHKAARVPNKNAQPCFSYTSRHCQPSTPQWRKEGEDRTFLRQWQMSVDDKADHSWTRFQPITFRVRSAFEQSLFFMRCHSWIPDNDERIFCPTNKRTCVLIATPCCATSTRHEVDAANLKNYKFWESLCGGNS